MRKLIISVLLGLVFGITGALAQDAPRLPFDFEPVLAGNFGELRSDHFHAGLDFKTQGAVGKPVHALWDGYISRIRVTTGSGGVLDLVYDSGIKSVNMHLDHFPKEIQERVLQEQFEKESYTVDIRPDSTEYRVKKGDVVAYAGNTGYSFGPHLHLEFIDLATGDHVDPLPYFRSQFKDHQAPRAEGFIVEPYDGQGAVDGSSAMKTYPVSQKAPVKAWGKIGLGIKAYDYLDGATNKCGVRSLRMEVDGILFFESLVDRFKEGEDLYINSWVRNGYMRCWTQPGNKLSMLSTLDGNGILDVTQERVYTVRFIMEDAHGNVSTETLKIEGVRQDINQPEHKDVLLWNKTNTLDRPGMSLVVPRGSLYDDAPLAVSVSPSSSLVSFNYQLSAQTISLHQMAEISIKPTAMPLEDMTKYYMCRVSSRGLPSGSLSSTYDPESGFLTARTNKLSGFGIAIDTIPPTVEAVNEKNWVKSGRIQFRIKDQGSGYKGYRVEIDGTWALFGVENTVSGIIVGRLDRQRIQKGRKHELVFKVWDACGNETEQTFTFTY